MTGGLLSDDAFPSNPKGYRHTRDHPVLRGQNFCRYCFCSPCVIELPPDFLRGYCSPHPGNDEKRYRLYRLFWGLLNTLGVWRDDEYLQMKSSRTSVDDRREIIPKCIINVTKMTLGSKAYNNVKLYTHRRYEDATLVLMGITGTTCPHLKRNLLWNSNHTMYLRSSCTRNHTHNKNVFNYWQYSNYSCICS